MKCARYTDWTGTAFAYLVRHYVALIGFNKGILVEDIFALVQAKHSQ